MHSIPVQKPRICLDGKAFQVQSVSKLAKLRRLLGNLGAWPEVQQLIAKDRRGETHPEKDPAEHIANTAAWLTRAQDAVSGGVSAAYHLRLGWLPPFPETTGYIIPTFFDYAAFSGNSDYKGRALTLAAWERRIQRADGAVRTGIGVNEAATVFDTGQGLFGFVRAWEESGDAALLEAARSAGNWLLERQDGDGCWRRNTFLGVPHTYNTRSAWALLRLWQATGEAHWLDGARRNLEWAATRQSAEGWLSDCAFRPDEDPLTHTLAYALRGFLEGGLMLKEECFIDCALAGARPLRDRALASDRLAGTYGPGWRSDESFSCLTGNAQMAIVFLILENQSPGEDFLDAARRLCAGLRRQQDLSIRHGGIRGGIKGSVPVTGVYSPLAMLNWAAKFALDAFMLETAAGKGLPAIWARKG